MGNVVQPQTRVKERVGAAWGRTIDRLVDGARVRQPLELLPVAGILAAALGLVGGLVYATNGTNGVFPHLMYLPVIAASLTLGQRGGLLTALAAGSVVGALMPLNVAQGLAQPLEQTLARTALFMLIAIASAALAAGSHRRHVAVLAAKKRIADLLAHNLRLFARLIAERDEQTSGHGDRVASNAVTLGRALGVDEPALRQLFWAGILHDLGKRAVPQRVLQKPGALTAEEFATVRGHPGFGAGILLQASVAFSDIAEGLRSHHERWDGTGYPDRLQGAAIPLFGRILAVGDVFEAVTSHRPYRAPMSRAAARALIAAGAGTHFDPVIAEAFLKLESSGLIVREPEMRPLFEDQAVGTPPHDPLPPLLFN